MSARPNAAPSAIISSEAFVNQVLQNLVERESYFVLDLGIHFRAREQIVSALSQIFFVTEDLNHPWQLVLKPIDDSKNQLDLIQNLRVVLQNTFRGQTFLNVTLEGETLQESEVDKLQEMINGERRDRELFAIHNIFPLNIKKPERIFSDRYGRKLIRISLEETKEIDEEIEELILQKVHSIFNRSLWELFRQHEIKKLFPLFKMYQDLKKNERDRKEVEQENFLPAGGLDSHLIHGRLFIFFPHYFPISIVEEVARFFEKSMQRKTDQICGKTEEI